MFSVRDKLLQGYTKIVQPVQNKLQQAELARISFNRGGGLQQAFKPRTGTLATMGRPYVAPIIQNVHQQVNQSPLGGPARFTRSYSQGAQNNITSGWKQIQSGRPNKLEMSDLTGALEMGYGLAGFSPTKVLYGNPIASRLKERGITSLLETARTTKGTPFGGLNNLSNNFNQKLSNRFTGIGTEGLGIQGPAGMALDYALDPDIAPALAGKLTKGFKFRGAPKSNFSLDKNTYDELIEAEEMIRNPAKFTKAENKEALIKIRELGNETIERLSAKYLPNKQLVSLKTPQAKIKALVDLHAQNRLGNVPDTEYPVMGLVGNKPPKGVGEIKTLTRETTGNEANRGGKFFIEEGKPNPYKNMFGKTTTETVQIKDSNPLVIGNKYDIGSDPRAEAIKKLLTPQEQKILTDLRKASTNDYGNFLSTIKRQEYLIKEEQMLSKALEKAGYTSLHFPDEIFVPNKTLSKYKNGSNKASILAQREKLSPIISPPAPKGVGEIKPPQVFIDASKKYKTFGEFKSAIDNKHTPEMGFGSVKLGNKEIFIEDQFALSDWAKNNGFKSEEEAWQALRKSGGVGEIKPQSTVRDIEKEYQLALKEAKSGDLTRMNKPEIQDWLQKKSLLHNLRTDQTGFNAAKIISDKTGEPIESVIKRFGGEYQTNKALVGGRELTMDLNKREAISKEAEKLINNVSQPPKPQSTVGGVEPITSVNPTGSLLVDYTPKARVEAPLGQNMTTLANTMKKSPNETITIYRGVSKAGRTINPGDFITTDINSARSYGSNILSKKVKLGDIIDDIEQPLGGDYLYRPGASKELKNVSYDYKASEWYKNYSDFLGKNKGKYPTLQSWLDDMKASGKPKSQLTEIWNKATAQAPTGGMAALQESGIVMGFAGTPRRIQPPKGVGEMGATKGSQQIPAQATKPSPLVMQPQSGQLKTISPVPGQLQTNVTKPSQMALPEAPQAGKPGKPGGTNRLPPSAQSPLPNDIHNYTFGVKDRLYTESMDRFHPISKLAKLAKKDKEVRGAIAQYYGSGGTADYHLQYELSPILKQHNIKDIKEAAVAMRDVELANRGIKGSPQQKSAQANLEALQQRLGPEKMQQLGNTLKQLYKFQDDMVKRYLVDTGIMSQKSYDAMRKNNQFYVPMKRVMDQVDEFLGIPVKKGAGSVGKQNVIFGIKGSDKDIVDPIESIVENVYKMVSLGRRQQVARSIVGLKKELPNIVTRTPISDSKNTIGLFENGKKVFYKVPEEIAESARGMGEEQLVMLAKILKIPTDVFRTMTTGVNPEFLMPNVSRDLQSAFFNAGVNPVKWAAGLAHMLKQDDVYKGFLKSGARTSRISLNRPYIKRTAEELSGNVGFKIKTPKDIFRGLEILGQYSEQPTRLAAYEKIYKQGIKNGLSQEEALKEAAYWAQEGTVNFARRGSKMTNINAIYAYLNARLQGVDRSLRTIKNNPGQAGIRYSFGFLAPALALYAWNNRFPEYNDERIVPKYEKENNFIFMLPKEGPGGIRYLKVPKAEIGKLTNPVEAYLDYARDKGGDVWQSTKNAIAGFSPIDDVGGVIPTALRPVVESGINKNFYTGYEIVPDYKQNYPKGYQDSPYTSPLYRMAGQKTNVSPAKLQHIVESYGGGIARFADLAARPFIPDQYISPKNEMGAPINRTPIVRRFAGGEKKSEQEQMQSNVSKYKAINYDISEVKAGIKRGDIPMEEGLKQINKLQQEQKNAVNSALSANTEIDDLKLDMAKEKVKSQGGVESVGNYKIFKYKDEVKTIDMGRINKLPTEPTETGFTELDKEMKSTYKSELSTIVNDVRMLYETGQISLEQAAAKLKEINDVYVGVNAKSSKGKKAKKTISDAQLLSAYKKALAGITKAKTQKKRETNIIPTKRLALKRHRVKTLV